MGQRIFTGAMLVLALIAVLAIGGWVFAVVAAAAICVAMREEYHALTVAGHRPVQWPTWAGMLLAIPMLLVLHYRMITPLLLGICLATFLVVIFRDEPKLEDAMLSIMPLVTITLPGMMLISFLSIEPKSLQIVFYALVFVVAILGDTCAYFAGSRIGGKKLCPQVSPNKTISGAVGGLMGSVLGALLVGGVAALIAPSMTSYYPTFLEYILIGLLGGVAGQLGDLFASLIKRHCNIKDFSGIFPGHGGMMDRMDSILFVTTIVFCYRLMSV